MRRSQLEIVKPCTRDWAEMSGTSTVRHCASCSKSVYNLSMLTEREADAALAVRPSEVCVIYYVDAEDRVVFHPTAEPAPWSSKRRTLVAAVAASAIAACSQPAVDEQEALPVAIANSHAASTAEHDRSPRVASTPAKSSSAAPVDADGAASATPTTETEACDPRWEGAFKEKGRGTQHLRTAIPKPGGLRSRHDYEGNDPMLGLYENERLPSPEPTPGGPDHSDLARKLREAQAVVDTTCKGEGDAVAEIRIAGRTGRVTEVRISGVERASAACVEKAVRRVKVTKFPSKAFTTKTFFRLKP